MVAVLTFSGLSMKCSLRQKKKRILGNFTLVGITHIFYPKYFLRNEQYFDDNKKFKVLDFACGTGGFLTEAFSVLRNAYAKTNTLTPGADYFLENGCFYGIDVMKENIIPNKTKYVSGWRWTH